MIFTHYYNVEWKQHVLVSQIIQFDEPRMNKNSQSLFHAFVSRNKIIIFLFFSSYTIPSNIYLP